MWRGEMAFEFKVDDLNSFILNTHFSSQLFLLGSVGKICQFMSLT
jgi:hypothetical protein